MYVHTSIPPTPSPSLSLPFPLPSPLYFYPANEYSLCSHASGTPFRSHTQLRTSLRLLISRSFWDRCVFLIFSFFITNFSRYSLSLSHFFFFSFLRISRHSRLIHSQILPLLLLPFCSQIIYISILT